MARAKFVKKARKAIPGAGIKVGDSYWWWKFRFGTRLVSKNKPRRSQLTQSEHLGSIYDIEDDLTALTAESVTSGFLDEFTSRIEEVRDTCQERLDNMPEQLQGSNSGSTLQEYIDNLESWLSDLESVETDIDEDELREEAAKLYMKALEDCKPATLEDPAEEPEETEEEIFERLLLERKEEILEEAQGHGYPG